MRQSPRFIWASALGMAILLCSTHSCHANLSSMGTKSIKCHTWSDRLDGEPSLIPENWINDGYCDCRNGADETETEACAGQEFWPGSLPGSSDQSSDKKHAVGHLFQCPQQKKLQLTPSRLNDGVCDCCDGADEPAGLCKDDCAAILAAERAERAAFEAKFKEGSKKRKQAIQKFNDHKATVVEQLKKLEADLYFTNQELDRTNELVQTWKSSFLDLRLKQVFSRTMGLATRRIATKDMLDDGLKGLLEPLSVQELVWFIVHACQVAGELPAAVEGTTCLPLRLAGLDAGMVWEPKTYNLIHIEAGESLQRKQLADLLDHNIRHENKKWTLGDNSNEDGPTRRGGHHRRPTPPDRRRLKAEDEEFHDDVVLNDDHYDDPDGYYEGRPDDAIMDDDGMDRHHHRHESSTNEEDGTSREKRDELLELVQQQFFSKSRVAFLKEAARIIARIEEVSKASVEEDEEDDGEKSDNPEVAEPKSQPSFDPAAHAMVKSKLQKLERQIRRGLDYAVSAKVLVDATVTGDEVKDAMELMQLAMGTLNHGNLTTLHVWQIFQAIIPELQNNAAAAAAEAAQSPQTCLSPYAAASCPPHTIQRIVTPVPGADGSVGPAVTLPIPPATIVQAGERFCETLMKMDPAAQQQTCLSSSSLGEEESSADSIATVMEMIPSDIPPGFLGYHAPESRSNEDAFFLVFQDLSLEAEQSARQEREEIQAELNKLEGDKMSYQTEIETLRESIGGDLESSKLGPDGELHALKDTCHSIDAGKYTYELCLFGSASQKERDQSGRGTDLGKWSEALVDEATGDRIWKWDRGAKCWNGPARSATAIVTCGSEVVKVLTADEPETCRYQLLVESYVACDADFRRRHGL